MKSAFDDFSVETREYATIGCFLTFDDKSGFIIDIDSWMFSIPAAKVVFESIKRLHSGGHQVVYQEVVSDISDNYKDGYKAEHESFIKKAVESAYPIDKQGVDNFVSAASLRKLLKDLERTRDDIGSGKYDYESALNKVDGIRINSHQVSSGIKEFSPGNFYTQRVQILKRREETKQIFFGYRTLDELIVGGQRKKEISVIAGRPSMGKSAAKANLIRTQSNLGFRVASIATEQTEEVETDRIDSINTGIHLRDIANSREWSDGDARFKQIIDSNKFIDKNWNYFLNVRRNISTESVAAWLRNIINRYGEIDVCYIDLFDKLTDINIESKNDSLISSKLGFLNQVAEELNIHICLLVQIHRAAVKDPRSDHRPKMHNLKGSGSFEEVARLILLLHREKYYNSKVVEDVIEFNIAKQNNGPAGDDITANLLFNKDTVTIVERTESVPNIY